VEYFLADGIGSLQQAARGIQVNNYHFRVQFRRTIHVLRGNSPCGRTDLTRQIKHVNDFLTGGSGLVCRQALNPAQAKNGDPYRYPECYPLRLMYREEYHL
jgi:hypothetical protein